MLTCLKLKVVLIIVIAIILSDAQAQPDSSILIENITVIPVNSEGFLSHQDILIENETIVEVAPHGTLKVPSSVDKIDATGRFALPGLWDSHIHLFTRDFGAEDTSEQGVRENIYRRSEVRLKQMLKQGITSVTDMGMTESLIPLAIKLRQRSDIPDFRFSGPLINGPRSRWSKAVEVNIEELQAVSEVLQRLKDYPVDFIKVYDAVQPDVFKAIAGWAIENNMSLAGHIPFSVTTTAAVTQGLSSIQHTYLQLIKDCTELGNNASFAPLSAWMKEGYGGRWARSSEIYQGHDKARCKQLYRLMAERGTYLVATPQLDLPLKLVVDQQVLSTLSPGSRESCQKSLNEQKGIDDKVIEQRFADLAEHYQELMSAGVLLVAGSDAPNDCMGFGRTLIETVELFGKLGLSPGEAIKTATLNAAKMANKETQGFIGAGGKANIVVLNRNPLLELSALHDVNQVILNGKVVR